MLEELRPDTNNTEPETSRAEIEIQPNHTSNNSSKSVSLCDSSSLPVEDIETGRR